MSALARWFLLQGCRVGGYDRTETTLTRELAALGVSVHYQDDWALVPSEFHNPETTRVVYTPAVPASHQELQRFRQMGFAVLKRSEVLGMLTEGQFTVAVAGTHGKTTTSAMVSHLLTVAGLNCRGFLGGIAANYRSNLVVAEGLPEETVFVVEADEYDRSFLRLYPDLAVVTAIEPDHLDIYGSEDAVDTAFSAFVGQVKRQVFVHGASARPKLGNAARTAAVQTYGNPHGAIRAINIRHVGLDTHFDLLQELESGDYAVLKDLVLPMPGLHNVENMTAAIAITLKMGVKPELIRQAVGSFKGVARRFEVVLGGPEQVFIDDYAHHPTEIRACLGTLKKMFPDKPLTVLFQPHLFSRTRDFAGEFAESLSLADQVWLMDIYPARELPIPGVSSQMLLNLLTAPNKCLVPREAVCDMVRLHKPVLLATVGAGDIDTLVPEIQQTLATLTWN
jgi:UDP-N-acetylmuramate--alanine ligase